MTDKNFSADHVNIEGELTKVRAQIITGGVNITATTILLNQFELHRRLGNSTIVRDIRTAIIETATDAAAMSRLMDELWHWLSERDMAILDREGYFIGERLNMNKFLANYQR